MSWTYSQNSGELSHDGQLVGIGYSGHGAGVNNPDMETVHDIGPLPRGGYVMEPVIDVDGKLCSYEGKAAPVIRLVPNPETEMFGRAGMLMHGDLRQHVGENLASKGCIVQSLYVREQVAAWIAKGDKDLEVTL